MICVAFAIWMFLILLAGMALYRLWTRQFGNRLVDWLLLPGTIVSELAYSNGLLLLGRPAAGGIISSTGNSYAPGQVPTGKYAFWVSVFASLAGLAGGCVAMGLVAQWIGRPTILNFALSCGGEGLPAEFPSGFAIIGDQGRLVGSLARTFAQQDWADWRTLVFLYLSICLAARLGVVRHDWRAALLTSAVVLGLLCWLGADIEGELKNAWPLLSYLWALQLSLLAVTLVIRGIVDFVRIVRDGPRTRDRDAAETE